MKRIILAGVLCLFAASAFAQTRVIIQNGTTPVATGNPFPVTCISGCSGGSGGAVTIADGADVTQGAIADAASTAGGTGTVNAHLRFLTSVAFATSTNQTSQITQETAINTVLGLQADAACATDNGACTNIALLKRSNQQRTSILAAIGTPMQQTGGTVGLVAGSAIIGNVRIDQTTPGTTNGVVVNSSALPSGAATAANQATMIAAMGSPMQQTGGTVGLVAGEAHVGEVGGNLLPITNDLTTSNATIATGQSIGGLQTLTSAVRVSGSLGASGTSGLIQSVLVSFKDAVAGTSIDIYFFNANPTGSTCTNTSAFALADADRDKVIGVVHMTDFTASNTAVVGQSQNQAMPFGVASATSIYACVVARASFIITSTANASLITRILRN